VENAPARKNGYRGRNVEVHGIVSGHVAEGSEKQAERRRGRVAKPEDSRTNISANNIESFNNSGTDMIQFPEDYGYTDGPWHSSRSVFENSLEHTRDIIDDSPEWRKYPNGIKGLPRSNDTPDYPSRIGKSIYVLIRSGKRVPLSGGNIRPAPPDKDTRNYELAYRMMKDIFSRLDLRNGELFTIANYIIERGLKKWREVRRNRPSRKDIALLVVAAIDEAVQVLSSTIKKNDLYDAALSSSVVGVKLSLEEIRSGVWRMKKIMRDIIQDIRKIYWENKSKKRGYSIVERSLNIANTIVYKLNIDNKKKILISKVAEKIILSSYNNGKDFYGKLAESIAAAAVYMSARLSDYSIGQRDTALLANVNETNVRKSFRFLVEDQVILIVPKIVKLPENLPDECPSELRLLRFSQNDPTS